MLPYLAFRWKEGGIVSRHEESCKLWARTLPFSLPNSILVEATSKALSGNRRQQSSGVLGGTTDSPPGTRNVRRSAIETR